MGYEEIYSKIKKITSREVLLLAVSKTKPFSAIQEVYKKGQIDFGENYVQELNEKIPAAIDHGIENIRWHFIGKLQTNKVNLVVGRVSLIHSVDSLRLAEKVSQRAQIVGIVQDILLEINVGGEETKSGFSPEELLQDFEAIKQLPGIRLKGIMALPPLLEDSREVRINFQKVKNLFEEFKMKLNADHRSEWKELSMGTTNDFEIAIEEGSTIVRIGTAIFGSRENRKLHD